MTLEVVGLQLTDFKELWARRFETSDRAILLWIRWLFVTILALLSLYSYSRSLLSGPAWLTAGLVLFYALTNVALTWATRASFSFQRWSIPLFLTDMTLLSLGLYYSSAPDSDLYIICFLIVYLATLSRRLRDAIPLAVAAGLLYAMLLVHKDPNFDWMDPQVLLRFPFFLVLSLFTSYLSEQADHHRRRIEQMQEIQTALARELQKTLVDLRDKQSALVQAEKMSAMGHMAGALAHEIRNPLSVIIGYVEDILADRSAEDPLRRPLEAVKRSSVRCRELMENLLTFSRQPKENETFKLKDALQEAMTLVRMSARMTQVQCNLDIRCDPLLSARRSEIQQVFINLMNNALDAMGNGGTLTVRLEEDRAAGQDWIKISVQDTGEGISPKVRSRIFEPFFTTKERGKGTGLGLSIVQDIVQSYRGVLEVDSRLHQGTTFTVRLPAAPTVPLAAAA